MRVQIVQCVVHVAFRWAIIQYVGSLCILLLCMEYEYL